MSGSVKYTIKHEKIPQTSSWSMLCPSPCQTHHSTVHRCLYLCAMGHSWHEAQGITKEVGHPLQAPPSASQSWDSCFIAPHNSACPGFRWALGRNKTIKSKEVFGGRGRCGSVWYPLPQKHRRQLCLRAVVGGHLPMLAMVYW